MRAGGEGGERVAQIVRRLSLFCLAVCLLAFEISPFWGRREGGGFHSSFWHRVSARGRGVMGGGGEGVKVKKGLGKVDLERKSSCRVAGGGEVGRHRTRRPSRSRLRETRLDSTRLAGILLLDGLRPKRRGLYQSVSQSVSVITICMHMRKG